jgi:hypothetical protein|tara:strand:- start:351 stop:536 length:186 start_codon:yes stop_codon:yes gene_type:complete
VSVPQVFLPPTRIAPDKMPITGPLADKTIMVTGAAGGYLDLLLNPASRVRAGMRPGAAPST